MNIYVWDGLNEVNYFSEKIIKKDEKGNEIIEEVFYPVTASKTKYNLTPESSIEFNSALEKGYYYRDRNGNKYVFENMTDEQKKEDYKFSVKYDSRLLVNMNYKGPKQPNQSGINAQ